MLFLLLLLLSPTTFPAQFLPSQCDQFPEDPSCQAQFNFAGATSGQAQQQHPCNYQDLWLIPGKADASCTRANPRKLVEMDPRHVVIQPPVIRFPGCFTVEIRNIRILGAERQGLPSSIFAKTEYQWLNIRGSENAHCQNASANGCGGFGNNCYYCDICESLKMADERPEQSRLPVGISDQLQGMSCPKEPGVYTFRKQFCFNDWRWLDSDGDCQLDLLSSSEGAAEQDQNGLRSAMAALQQVGFGTVVAKIRLAYNATPEIVRKKIQKEAQIERSASREAETQRRRGGWESMRSGALTFEQFRSWYVAEKRAHWHRDEYLPWLLYENEVACIRLTFDVCERAPQQRWDGSGGFTCV